MFLLLFLLFGIVLFGMLGMVWVIVFNCVIIVFNFIFFVFRLLFKVLICCLIVLVFVLLLDVIS